MNFSKYILIALSATAACVQAGELIGGETCLPPNTSALVIDGVAVQPDPDDACRPIGLEGLSLVPATTSDNEPIGPRLLVDTTSNDLICQINTLYNGQQTLPPAQDSNFLLIVDCDDLQNGTHRCNDSYPREYVLNQDQGLSSISQSVVGGVFQLQVRTDENRMADCVDDECATLHCFAAGTPIFSGDFEPIAADLSVNWSAVPGDGPLQIVAGAVSGTTMALTAQNTGSLSAGEVFVDVEIELPISGDIDCPSIVSGGNGIVFDEFCSGRWEVGTLDPGQEAVMELQFTAAADAGLGQSTTLNSFIDSPAVADIVPSNNIDTLELSVSKETQIGLSIASTPQFDLNLTNGSASVRFSIVADPQGPSLLNSPVDFELNYPDTNGVTLIESNNDFIPPVWSPQVGNGNEELVIDFNVDSFEPGDNVFCVEVLSVNGVLGSSVTIDPLSQTERCLDVQGPVSVALSAQGNAPDSVVAGTPAGVNPGNLLQSIALTNNNQSFDALNIEAQILLSAGAPADSLIPSIGNIQQDPVNSELYTWTISLLSAGQTANADIWFDVGPSFPDGDLVTATLQNVTIDPTQNLVDDQISTMTSTNVVRQIDLEVTAGQQVQSRSAVAPGSTLQYAFQINNLGDSNGSGIVLELAEQALPDDVTRNPVFATSGSFDPQTNTWTVGNLAVSASPAPQLIVSYAVGQDALIGETITASVSVAASNENDTNVQNDSQELTTTIQ